jgi:hypothetical protein
MSKLRSPDRPAAFWGKVVFEFFNNDDENLKRRNLLSLAKDAKKELGISALPVEEHRVENPERGSLVFSFCARNAEEGQVHLQKVLAFFDENALGRMISEEIDQTDIE